MSDMIEQERNGSGSPLGLFSRPLVWITFLALLAFLSFGFLGQFFFQAEKTSQTAARDFFKRLSIERPEKIIQAPDFTLEDLSGNRMNLHDFKGRVVFLNFWATWCIPCRAEMPQMEKLHREFKDQGLEIIAVNFREDKQTVRKFVAELGLTFRILLDPDGSVSNEYGAWSLPLSYFVDRKGIFIGKVNGDRPWDGKEARAFVRELLQRKD
jgi:peroxiredoxin